MRAGTLLFGILTFVCASHATAARIADLFSKGLFGLTWGASAEHIEAALPGGRWQQYGPVRTYWVAHTRSVLSIERSKKSRLGFTLNSEGRLNSVSIEFAPGSLDKWTELLMKVQEAFGPMRRPELESIAVGGVLLVEWEDDAGVTVNATNQVSAFGSGKITLGVSKLNFDAPKSKEALGFD